MSAEFLIEKRVEEAKTILAEGGFPFASPELRTEAARKRVCEVFLAVADIHSQHFWDKAKFQGDGHGFSLGTRDIIAYLNKYYGQNISPGSYDSIREKSLRHLIKAGFVVPSKPDAPKNDGTRGYALSPAAGSLAHAFCTKNWPLALEKFKAAPRIENDTERVSVSIVTQGSHKFYTCTIFSDILAQCCFVSTRSEDPAKGFQRLLDEREHLISQNISMKAWGQSQLQSFYRLKKTLNCET